MRALYVLVTFVGSFTLFLIEPMAAKALLPRFGGTSLVWNGCLVFFQAALLAGYAYANFLARRADGKSSFRIHISILVFALLATIFIFVPPGHWHVRPDGGANPIGPLLLTLLITAGPPFAVLAAGTPLIQRWYSATGDEAARDPYWLYAASNVGSFLGLLAYPGYIESHFALEDQRDLVLGLLTFYLGLLFLAFLTSLRRPPVDSAAAAPMPAEGRPSTWARIRWTALSAGPSALLLAATTELTKNIAPIPLLWVLPLGLYLLTFVVVFAKPFAHLQATRGKTLTLVASVILALGIGCESYLSNTENAPIVQGVFFGLAGFAAVAFACHSELSNQRPAPIYLTDYYLWVSVGGVVGGLFCALVAPAVFHGLTELPVALGACAIFFALFRPAVKLKSREIAAGLVAVALLIWSFGPFKDHTIAYIPMSGEMLKVLALTAIFVAVAAWRQGLAIAIIGYLAIYGFTNTEKSETVLYTARNYYGSETVLNDPAKQLHRLLNGSIVHGVQSTDPALAREPLTYYSKPGPLGTALSPILDENPSTAIAAVGLGTGTEAAYGRPGVRIDFYEINSAVSDIASNPRYFTYLRDSQAKVNVILGDARLSLEAAPDQSYDVIILDAFSSDSIPIHLLTKEAFQLYLRKLTPNGVIFVHVSNRYLRLHEAVAATARSLGLAVDFAEDLPVEPTEFHTGTRWMAISATRERLKLIEWPFSHWVEYTPPLGAPVWTDDYSNIFPLLRIGGG